MALLDSKQNDLFGAVPAQDARPRPCASDTGRRFIRCNAHEIVLGATRLEDWLKQSDQHAPFVVAHLLEQQDWLAFEGRYAGSGRAPYLPRQMMGSILYGVMQGLHSLRDNESRIITAFALDASSETRVIASMLDQGTRITGAQAEEVLLDAGYLDDKVIEATLARDVSLMCSDGQWPSRPTDDGLFHKSAFDYDELTDSYRCPAGQILLLEAKTRKTLNTLEHRVYGASVCGDCHCVRTARRPRRGGVSNAIPRMSNVRRFVW